MLIATLLSVIGLVSCDRATRQDPTPARPPAPPVASPLPKVTTEWPGITVEIADVTQADSSLLVALRFANTSQEAFEFGDRFAADPADRDTLADVSLSDASGTRRYFVLRDRSGRPLCSTGIAPLQPGERRQLFVRFPPPPDGTSRVTIQLPHAPAMRDVPIGR